MTPTVGETREKHEIDEQSIGVTREGEAYKDPCKKEGVETLQPRKDVRKVGKAERWVDKVQFVDTKETNVPEMVGAFKQAAKDGIFEPETMQETSKPMQKPSKWIDEKVDELNFGNASYAHLSEARYQAICDYLDMLAERENK